MDTAAIVIFVIAILIALVIASSIWRKRQAEQIEERREEAQGTREEAERPSAVPSGAVAGRGAGGARTARAAAADESSSSAQTRSTRTSTSTRRRTRGEEGLGLRSYRRRSAVPSRGVPARRARNLAVGTLRLRAPDRGRPASAPRSGSSSSSRSAASIWPARSRRRWPRSLVPARADQPHQLGEVPREQLDRLCACGAGRATPRA